MIELHYQGDRTDCDRNHLVGPDMGDGFLKPVAAEYDPLTDITNVRFAHLLRDRWPLVAVAAAGEVAKQRIALLFAEANLGSRRAKDRLGITMHAKAIDDALAAAQVHLVKKKGKKR